MMNGINDKDLLEAMVMRHSVRSYRTDKVDDQWLQQIQQHIDVCNQKSGLHIQLCSNESNAIRGLLAHYGHFKNANNYIALIGKKHKQLEELCGYYGELLCLQMTMMGLSTCWIASTYRKGKTTCHIDKDEKLVCIIAFGYGTNNGMPHKTKALEELCKVDEPMPSWFQKGMECVQLAPTALNQQKFLFMLSGNAVEAKAFKGPYSKIDLGIAKLHFELGAGNQGWKWKS